MQCNTYTQLCSLFTITVSLVYSKVLLFGLKLAALAGHCKHLTPEYKKLGAAVAANPALKNRVVIAKVSSLPSPVYIPKANFLALLT